MARPAFSPRRNVASLRPLDVLALLALAFTVIGIALWHNSSDLCGSSNIREVVAPDGVWKAACFRFDCGATTGFSTHVSILLPSQQVKNDGGNIFVVDDDQPSLSLRWVSRDHLQISGFGASATYKQLAEWNGVRITYLPTPTPP